MMSYASAPTDGTEIHISAAHGDPIPFSKFVFSAQTEKKEPDMALFWSSYADWAIKNPIVLQTAIKDYVSYMESFVFDLFPLGVDPRTVRTKKTITMGYSKAQYAVSKVPGRSNLFRVSCSEKYSTYHVQGFSMDYSFLKTPGGMNEWDMNVSVLAKSFYMVFTDQCMKEYTLTHSAYSSPESRFPYDHVPTTPKQLFDSEEAIIGLYNKEPHAFHIAGSYAARVFEQNDRTLRSWIVSKDDLYQVKLLILCHF